MQPEASLETRPEAGSDRSVVHDVHREAFGTEAEALLVDRLREADALAISLVATVGMRIVGHIAFSPVTISENPDGIRALGLGPIGVLPAHQRAGVGRGLMEAGLREAGTKGWALVFVIGEPRYYSRFGFKPASDHGLRWDREVASPYFMVPELRPGALGGTSGIVRYHVAFDSV